MVSSDAIAVAYRAHAQDVQKYLRMRTGCRSTAEDMTQDAFVRLCNSLRSEQILDVKSYLFRIAHNLLIDHHRSATRGSAPRELLDITGEAGEQLGLASPGPTAEEALVLEDELGGVARAIAHLPESCQRIFWLSRWLGFRNGEIAAMLGICMSTVEKNLTRAQRSCMALAQLAD